MTEAEKNRGRLRFEDFSLDRFPDGRCRATTRLGWIEGKVFLGEAEGTQTLEGELRAGAQAAVVAATGAAQGHLTLSLRGVKAIRAFDSWVIVVSVGAAGEIEHRRLIGAYPSEERDMARGAALAVMDATNRVLELVLDP
ncbi:hypothetical protein ACFL3S_10090 [Gemmatimonadota bacterium]